MSITGKVDAMMGGIRRENNAIRKNYERERTRATVLESRILHAFLAAVHAELPCPFCGVETGHVSPFARHIGDCVVETIELAAAPPPSVCTPALDVTSQHTPRSGAMLGARASDAASDLEKLAAEWLDKWVYTEPDDQPNLVPVLVRLLKSVRDGACSETAEPEWLETMKQRTRAAEEYARSRDFTSTLPDGEPEKKA